ncbi:MAG: ABC transporter permease [Saprospiraceae bacterium]|nr:ABC transporter permease [Saprospiraceae bacterium]
MGEEQNRPPGVAQRLLRSFIKPDLLEEVQGDMDENYLHQCTSRSKHRADLNYWYQTLNYMRPFAVRGDILDYLNPFFMWKHNLVIGWRVFRNNLAYGSINVFGLSAGLACVMLITIFVKFEYSYDTFHDQYDRIYRIIKEDPDNYYLGNNRFTVTPAPLVTALPLEIPEVQYAAQIRRCELVLEFSDFKSFQDGIYATEDFFKVFTFPLLHGDPNSALSDPKSIVLTETTALKYFRDINPIGENLRIEIGNEKIEFTVAAIMRDVPTNSHLQFDYIVPISSAPRYRRNMDNWDSSSYLTYAVLRSDHSLSALSQKLVALARDKLL